MAELSLQDFMKTKYSGVTDQNEKWIITALSQTKRVHQTF